MRRARFLPPDRTLLACCAVAALGALLGACAAPAAGPGVSRSLTSDAAAWPGTAPAPRSDIAVSHAKASWLPLAVTEARYVPATAPADRVPLTLQDLKGRTAHELTALLGEPKLRLRDGPAQVWQYAGQGCVLHLYLYQEDGSFRVTYGEVRIDDPQANRQPACVAPKSSPSGGESATAVGPLPTAPLIPTSARIHQD